MKNVLMFFFCNVLFLFSIQSFAQMPLSKIKEVAAKIAALPIKPGEWIGTASMQMGTNKMEIEQWEKITYMLDSTVILIEGIGKTEGQTRHHAVAMLGYDPIKQMYLFRSFKDGYVVDADCKLYENGKFEWAMKNLRGETRYIVWQENNLWHEIGEFSADSGKTWNKFLEMTLHKK